MFLGHPLVTRNLANSAIKDNKTLFNKKDLVYIILNHGFSKYVARIFLAAMSYSRGDVVTHSVCSSVCHERVFLWPKELQ